MLDHRAHSAAELDLIRKRERRERLEREEARATRERLEKSSPSAPRLSFVEILNGFSAMTAGGLPGLQAIEEVRKVQALNRWSGTAHTTAHDRLMKSCGGVERFNRLGGSVADTSFDIGPMIRAVNRAAMAHGRKARQLCGLGSMCATWKRECTAKRRAVISQADKSRGSRPDFCWMSLACFSPL